MKKTLFDQRFIPRKFYPRDVDFEPRIYTNETSGSTIESVRVEMVTNAKYSWHAPPAAPNVGEAYYSLSISDDGSTQVTTTSVAGGLHALQTFTQLFSAHSQWDTGVYTPHAPVNINDEPEFGHRGLKL